MGPLHRLVLWSWDQAGAGGASQVHFGISIAVSSTAESPVAPLALTAGNGFYDSNMIAQRVIMIARCSGFSAAVSKLLLRGFCEGLLSGVFLPVRVYV